MLRPPGDPWSIVSRLKQACNTNPPTPSPPTLLALPALLPGGQAGGGGGEEGGQGASGAGTGGSGVSAVAVEAPKVGGWGDNKERARRSVPIFCVGCVCVLRGPAVAYSTCVMLMFDWLIG